MEALWKILKKYTYLLVFVVPLGTLAGLVLGGSWTFLVPIVAWVIIPIMDLIIGEDRSNYTPDEEKAMDGELYYRLITWLYVPAHYASLGYGIWLAAQGHWTTMEWVGNLWGLAFQGGITIMVAHELGHKQNAFEKWLAMALLHTVFYGHFMNEHNKGHHAMVSTPEDPATSRFGQNFYAFLPQTVIGTFQKACQLEATRLERLGKSAWHISNEMYRNVAYPLLALIALYFSLGWQAAAFLAVTAIGGFGLLEIVNYIEHYGLERRKMANGRYERVAPVHSWNSNALLTNCFLFHLQRHSDHHTWPNRRYQTLRNFEESPQMPTGYAGMVLLAAIPPLWFAVMDPKVKAFMQRQQETQAVEGVGIMG